MNFNSDMKRQAVEKAEPKPQIEVKNQGSGKVMAGIMLAAALAVGSLGGVFLTGGSGDSLSLAEQERISREFAAASQAPLLLGEVSKDQVPEKVAELGLPTVEAERLIQDIGTGKSRMLLLGLVDYASEDGDIVRITSGGLSVEVSLFKGVNMVAIPVAGDGPAEITVTGVYDGGGGITISGSGPNGQLPLPLMSVGQSVSFTVQ